MKHVVISGAYGYGNLGDEAILTALLAGLRANCPDLQITVLSSDPAATCARYSVSAVQSVALPPSVREIGRFAVGIAGWSQLWHMLQAIGTADLLVIGGGGLLYDYMTTRKARLLNRLCLYGWPISHWAMQVIAAKIRRTAVMLCGIGVGPVDSRLGGWLMRHVIGRADLITVRDPDSGALLRELGVHQIPIHETADLAYLLSPAPRSRAQTILEEAGVPLSTARPLIGMVPRLWYSYINRDGSAGRHQESRFHRQLAGFADAVVETLRGELVFIPTQKPWGQQDDLASAREIVSQMRHSDHAYLIEAASTPEEAMAVLGEMGLVVSMRLHGLILAAATGVPVVGLAYDPKVRSFLCQVDQAGAAVDIDPFDPQVLLRTVRETWELRDRIRCELNARIPLLQRAAERNVELALKLLRGSPNT